MYKTVGYIFIIILLLFFLFLGISILGIIKYTTDLPDYKQLREYSPSVISRLYTGDGSLLAEFSLEKRIFVPNSSIPDLVKNAFISAEDKNFYNHKGLDFLSISKAFIININNLYKGKRLIGASTITQQVAKNFLLNNEVSMERKIREALLSLRIERILSKDRILELYLNEIFLGQRSYGVAAAALNYFNKSLDELVLSEIAYLAGLPKGPNNYHPVRNKKAAINRRNYVLKRMYEDDIVSKEQYIKASLEPIEQVYKTKNTRIYAPYFIEEVRRNIIDKYGEKSLYREGLSVITTIDPSLQNKATAALREGLERYDKRQGWRGPISNVDAKKNFEALKKKYKNYPGVHDKIICIVRNVEKKRIQLQKLIDDKIINLTTSNLKKQKWINNGAKNYNFENLSSMMKENDIIVVSKVSDQNNSKYVLDQIPSVNGAILVIDPRNGRVLAMSGGYDFDGSEFNRATQAKRQPGSAFKPFVYLAALENGYLPNTKILDAPLVIDQGPGLEKWKPKNYSGNFYGPSTLRIGLEKSRNVMTVRLANQIGMKKIINMSNRFRLKNYPPLLATSLGAEETTLIQLVAAYASFVNGGRYNKPAIIEKIQDRKGKIIFRRDTRACTNCNAEQQDNYIKPILSPEGDKIIDAEHAFQLTWILKGVTKRGTAKSLKNLKFSLAGKTGTTNDNMDAWFLGFSPELVVGVYVGYDKPRTLGKNETGGRVAVPIFSDFITNALTKTENRPFLVPENIEMVKIDYLTGEKTSKKNKKTIYEAFIKGTLDKNKKSDANDNEVIKGFENNLY